MQRRWAGEDVDLDQPLPSDLILAAAEADPGIRAAVATAPDVATAPAAVLPACAAPD